MATDSKFCQFSLRRCKTPPRRRELSPRFRVHRSKEKSRKSASMSADTDKRSRNVRNHFGGRYADKTGRTTSEMHKRRKKSRTDLPKRRILNYGRYSESNCTGDRPGTISEIEKNERHREDGREYHSRPQEYRRESRRRAAMRSRHEEDYDDAETHWNRMRMPMTLSDNYKCQNGESRLVVRPPLPVVVPRPGRILLPARFVPRMRPHFPACAVRGGVAAPVLLAPVVFLRGPMMPLRPQIQPGGL